MPRSKTKSSSISVNTNVNAVINTEEITESLNSIIETQTLLQATLEADEVKFEKILEDSKKLFDMVDPFTHTPEQSALANDITQTYLKSLLLYGIKKEVSDQKDKAAEIYQQALEICSHIKQQASSSYSALEPFIFRAASFVLMYSE